jgi:hypothetical protein
VTVSQGGRLRGILLKCPPSELSRLTKLLELNVRYPVVSRRSKAEFQLTEKGRILPFATFWADSLHRTTMLQCDGQETAAVGRTQGARASQTEAPKRPFVL